MNIADRIQNLRKSKGISQEELADKVWRIPTSGFKVGKRTEYPRH